MMKNYGIPVAAEGWLFIVPLAIVTALLFALDWKIAGYVSLTLTLFVLFFFRDPQRNIPRDAGAVVSPADGKVIVIKDVHEADYLKQDVKQVSIFLTIFNVHVNRIPYGGTVELVYYHPGKFHVASADKASLENEQTAVVIKSGERRILVKQIAGLIARRIVCYAKPAEDVTTGERYGLIRFGSRVDIFLPKDVEMQVAVGDWIKGGKDILGVLR